MYVMLDEPPGDEQFSLRVAFGAHQTFSKTLITLCPGITDVISRRPHLPIPKLSSAKH